MNFHSQCQSRLQMDALKRLQAETAAERFFSSSTHFSLPTPKSSHVLTSSTGNKFTRLNNSIGNVYVRPAQGIPTKTGAGNGITYKGAKRFTRGRCQCGNVHSRAIQDWLRR
jgi:hypothetical protein